MVSGVSGQRSPDEVRMSVERTMDANQFDNRPRVPECSGMFIAIAVEEVKNEPSAFLFLNPLAAKVFARSQRARQTRASAHGAPADGPQADAATVSSARCRKFRIDVLRLTETPMPLRFAFCILLSFAALVRADSAATTLPTNTATAVAPADALRAYVARPDISYGWKELGRSTLLNVTAVELTLTSQTWQGTAWKHRLVILLPQHVHNPKQALLMITGGSWRGDPKPEDGPVKIKLSPEALALAGVIEQLSCPIAILYNVPFQPMFGGKREDALIAYSFDKFFDTADPTWPLLLPMTKSAARAMDAVQEFLKTDKGIDVESFTVTGASKRGWTTWLTAAVDPRVAAAAPMVIDMLNMNAQGKHQLEVWGEYSPQIQDYVELNIPQRMQTQRGADLRRIVDPWSYRERLVQPKLIFLGSNDPYWPVDSSNFYWGDLRGDKYLTIVPNAGHDLARDFQRIIGTLITFHEHVRGQRDMPKMQWHVAPRDGDSVLTVQSDAKPREAAVWLAHADSRDFRRAKWTKEPMRQNAAGGFEYAVHPNGAQATALFGELVFEGRMPFYLSTNVSVFGAAK
jgi:PhoPQ-activated pathogenicity-related protein